MRKNLILSAAALLSTLFVIALAPPAQAFHGAWWRGSGTAGLGAATFSIDLVWGGQDSVIDCAGGGCRGTGDGWYRIKLGATTLATVSYLALEDVRNIFIAPGPGCGSLEVTPNYTLTGASVVLTGRQENCLDNFPLSFNRNTFTGVVGPFATTIRANGGFGGAPPPPGAAAGWCCHG